jgi:hypothetical protein
LSIGRSTSSNNMRRLAPRCRVTRSLSVVTQSRIASFNSVIEKNRRLRSLAMIQRVASSTATSTLALSRGLYGRAGTIGVP